MLLPLPDQPASLPPVQARMSARAIPPLASLTLSSQQPGKTQEVAQVAAASAKADDKKGGKKKDEEPKKESGAAAGSYLA